MTARTTHEDFTRELHKAGGSDRSFGFVFAVAFLSFGLFPLIQRQPVRWWSVALSLLVSVVAAIKPRLLHTANELWTAFGVLLGKVMQPVVTAVLFYGVFTPLAVGLRWRKRDLLGLSWHSEKESYWSTREETAEFSSMLNQF